MAEGGVPQVSTADAQDSTERVDDAIRRCQIAFESAERKLSDSIAAGASSLILVRAKDEFDRIAQAIRDELDELNEQYTAESGSDKAKNTQELVKTEIFLGRCRRCKRLTDREYKKYMTDHVSLPHEGGSQYTPGKALSQKSGSRASSSVSQAQLQIERLEAQAEEEEAQIELKFHRATTRKQIAELKASSESSRGSVISLVDSHNVRRETLTLNTVSTVPVTGNPITSTALAPVSRQPEINLYDRTARPTVRTAAPDSREKLGHCSVSLQSDSVRDALKLQMSKLETFTGDPFRFCFFKREWRNCLKVLHWMSNLRFTSLLVPALPAYKKILNKAFFFKVFDLSEMRLY